NRAHGASPHALAVADARRGIHEVRFARDHPEHIFFGTHLDTRSGADAGVLIDARMKRYRLIEAELLLAREQPRVARTLGRLAPKPKRAGHERRGTERHGHQRERVVHSLDPTAAS